MNDYNLNQHPPIADFRDEVPTVPVHAGPEAIKVTLDHWGPCDPAVWSNLLNQEHATFGDKVELPKCHLSATNRREIASLFTSPGMPQILEQFTYSFRVEGVSLNCTHQLVRSRIGASFLQQSMRTNDARHMEFTIPETIDRTFRNSDMAKCMDGQMFVTRFLDYLRDLGVENYIPPIGGPRGILVELLKMQKAAYAALVDSGVPFQDARRFLGSGHLTHIWCNYNWPALKGVIGNRTEHSRMDWEIDCVAQLMHREVWRKCPVFMAHGLGSRSDAAGKDMFTGVGDWPSPGKWPGKTEKEPIFSPEQCPYWVLDPVSYTNDEPPVWIPTNGVFPWEEWCSSAERNIPDHPWLSKYKEITK